ncbi:MAG: enoyl-[acyl-carrier-protein] reductase FabL [Chloroflexi bacterium CG07_land_8_20_14_0_80_45_17]|nr:MAG: enoyl-[acyl-carrier-protein] reductase FabL [Chloroflexi bacterium CG23_combo_of_CG06-09_8_20_14_all_45_10]PIU56378.1 MAG: enoyl-[acyl-carrier-protein] reductase FabL [Chloroflexi bacterium CG07_land_8_20_14_0_80_45_17]
MPLKGKLTLVTGSGRGIGRAIALKLASQGSDIIVNFFRRREAAEKTAKDIEALGVKAEVIRANVGDPAKLDEMFDTIATKFGHLDILINNAASGVGRSVLDVDIKAWDWTMNINARAFLLCAQRAAKLMEGRGGKMVSITSLGSSFVLPTYAVVGISKAALEALTRYLAIELAPKGICVNAVAASAVETEALKFYIREGLMKDIRQATPAGRMVIPEDVANVVAFLCSEEAFMIRGQTIIVDGGTSVALFMAAGKEER